MLTKFVASFWIAWSWTLAHPALLWFSITFVVNAAFKDASAYVDRHPNFAIVKKIFQKLGISPRGAATLFFALLTKNRAAAEAVIGTFGKVSVDADITQPVKVPTIPEGTSALR